MSNQTSRKLIRGSGLLLSGRMLSLFLNLLTQVLIVRYLSKVDYGMFAYALALVSTATSLNRLGMEQAVARFVPIYEEKDDRAAAAGTIALAFLTMVGLGTALVTLVIGLRGLLADTVVDSTVALNLLLVLVLLSPVGALNSLLQELFSALGKPRIIFFRKYIAGPCLKLMAVTFVIVTSGGVQTLAVSYTLAGLFGLLLYGAMVPRVLQDHRLSEFILSRTLKIKFRRIFRYSTPIFVADMANVLRFLIVIVVIEYFRNLSDVADYRAVVPIARLNSVALLTFSMLFLPMASRFFAKMKLESLGEAQSEVALWVTVLSYPIFASCICLAEPLVVTLLGASYAPAAPILAMLAVGHFFKSALGLNRQTLRALGKVRLLLYIEIAATLVVFLLSVALVPSFGAIGGAAAAALTMIVYSSLNTITLWRTTGNNPLPWTYAKRYILAAICALGLWFSNSILDNDSILISIILAALSSLVVLLSSWKLLHAAEIFPEVLRLVKKSGDK